MNFKEEDLSIEQSNILKEYRTHLYVSYYFALKNNSYINDLITTLKVNNLLFEEDKIVLESITELFKEEEHINSVKVIAFANKKWDINLKEYFDLLWTIIKKDIDKQNFNKSISIVIDSVKKINFFEKLKNLPSKSKKNFEEIVKLIDEDVSSIRGNTNKSDKKFQYNSFRERVIKAKESFGNKEVLGFKSYLTELDNLILGFEEESMNVIAARPGMGKTALILSIIANHIKNDSKEHILFFSLEMPSEQLISRLVSILTKIELSKIRAGDLSEEEVEEVLKCSEFIENSNFHIEDNANVTIFDIEKISTDYSKKFKLSSVFIDYIQLISAPQGMDRRLAVDEISRKIKLMAKSLKLPLIALSQLNRNLEQRSDKRPMMSDLRESGAIEQDADRIIFLYRESVYDEDKVKKEYPEDIAEVILAKNRNGPSGVVYTKYIKKNTYFIDADSFVIQKEIIQNIKSELQSYGDILEEEFSLDSDIFNISIGS